MQKTKIIIAGIGAVGGYFGGVLAAHYENDPAIEINFLARGAHLKAIQAHGLRVVSTDTEFIAKPTLASDDAAALGLADVIIIATKSYDLEAVIAQLQPCINPATIILPLLNGVDGRERIQTLLPNNLVLDGCVYLVARLKEAGVIENSGKVQTLFFGLPNYTNARLEALETIFKNANIQATLAPNISTVIWEKFIFIAPTATATSYYNQSIGALVADPEKLATVKALIEEVKQIAQAKHITFAADITEKSITRLQSMPFEATSSMHFDYQNHKPHTEIESLTGYVIKQGEHYNMETPVFKGMYEGLREKSK